MDKLCIITGGSRGIGAAMAQLLSSEGYRIALIYHKSHDSAEQLVKSANMLGRDMRGYSVDVADNSAFAETLNSIYSDMGNCSLLINNAGIANSSLLMDMTYYDFTQMLNVNYSSVYTAIHAVIPQMLRLEEGVIINIASVWGNRAASCESAYSATKAAIIALTRSLARELGGNNIRVNSISPGFISTDMTAAYNDNEASDIIENIPLARIGTPQDVAELALFLASDKASYITGQDIIIDGGWQC